MAVIKANQDNAVFISNEYQQGASETDWVNNSPSIDYKVPEIETSTFTSTNTSLITGTTVVQGENVKLYSSTDGVVDGVLGTTTAVVGTTGTHDIFNDGSAVATYNLDGDANDLGGNYNGTATDVTYDTGKFGNAVDLAGYSGGSSSPKSSNFIRIDDLGIVPADNTTFSFWVNISSLTQSSEILVFGNNANNHCFSMGIDSDGYPYISSTTYETIKSTISIDINNWHNIVFCFNNSTNGLDFYVDNAKDTIVSSFHFGTDSGTQKVFGGHYDSNYNSPGIAAGYAGLIDQVRIFNKALTATEVDTLYNEQSTKYTADISSLNLIQEPTKAYFNKSVTISTVTESTSSRCIAQDEILDFVSSTTTEYVGTNSISGLLQTGDSIQLDGATDVVTSEVVESGTGPYTYTCTVPEQSTAPTSAKVLDRSVLSTEASDVFDGTDTFTKTYNPITKQGRNFKYKVEGDTDVEVDKVVVTMQKLN